VTAVAEEPADRAGARLPATLLDIAGVVSGAAANDDEVPRVVDRAPNIMAGTRRRPPGARTGGEAIDTAFVAGGAAGRGAVAAVVVLGAKGGAAGSSFFLAF